MGQVKHFCPFIKSKNVSKYISCPTNYSELVLESVAVRFFFLPVLKSVSYQPLPDNLKAGADICLLTFTLSQLLHLGAGTSLLITSFSNPRPQSLQAKSKIGIFISKYVKGELYLNIYHLCVFIVKYTTALRCPMTESEVVLLNTQVKA